MKKFLFVLALICFISQQVEAKIRVIRNEECPKDIICQENEILGDDGKCYPCDASEKISIQCIGYNKVQQICPDRLFSYPMVWSSLNCDENEEVYQGEGNTLKSCVFKCPVGYDRVSINACENKKTGEFFAIDI